MRQRPRGRLLPAEPSPHAAPAARPAAPPQVTGGVVLTAIRRIGLPSLTARTQPEDKTLVNFATIFYTEPTPFTRSVTLLGQRVRITATPRLVHLALRRRHQLRDHDPRRALPRQGRHPPLHRRPHDRPHQRRRHLHRPLPGRQRPLAGHPRHRHHRRTERTAPRQRSHRAALRATSYGAPGHAAATAPATGRDEGGPTHSAWTRPRLPLMPSTRVEEVVGTSGGGLSPPGPRSPGPRRGRGRTAR